LGPQGPNGEFGDKGQKGQTGATGPQGPSGTNGTGYDPCVCTVNSQTISAAQATIAITQTNAGDNITISSNTITVGATGTYLLTYAVTLQNNLAARNCVGFYVKGSGGSASNVDGSASYEYFRYNTYGEFSSLTACVMFHATSGNQFQLTAGNALDGSWNHTVQSAGVYRGLSITRLS
jgi:hypothetical protein